MELDVDPCAEDFARELHRLVNGGGGGGAGGVLETDAVKGDASLLDEFKAPGVELGRVGALVVDAGGQAHHRHDDLVLEAGVVDALAGPLEVVDVVEGVEVADRGHAVLLEHVGMELDHVARLGLETDDVDAAGEGLEVRVRSGLAELVHHVEGVFLAVEVAGLEARAAASLEPADARVVCGLDGREEILGENACADDGLEAIAECGAHELDVFLCHGFGGVGLRS